MEYKLSGDWEEFCDAVVEAVSLRETDVEYIVEDNEVHNKKDKGYKYLLSIKKNFIEFVKTFMKITWNEEIREEDIKLLDKEFITVDFDKKESDLIYEVKVKNEKAYFVLIEIQSKVDRKMSYRLLNYMVEIWRKWEVSREKKREKFYLPKIIPCVLYTGKEKWTAPIEFRNLYSDIKENEEYLINFKYILIDVHRYKPEELLKVGNIISSAFYLETSTKEELKKRLITLAESFINVDKETIEEFKRWLLNVIVIDEEKQKIIEEKFVKEEEEMSNLAQIGREIYEDGVRDGLEQGLEKGLERGLEQGLEKGLEQGLEQGIEEGRKQGKILTIRNLLVKKLKVKNEEVKALIENVSSEKLDEIEDKIFEIKSCDDVIEILKR